MTSVGIDVSKGKSMVCILKPYGEMLVAPYEVVHTMPELDRLVSLIQSLEGEVRIVMEATGAYHLPLVSRSKEAGLFVSVVNPYIMKKYAQSEFRKGKTDKMDSIPESYEPRHNLLCRPGVRVGHDVAQRMRQLEKHSVKTGCFFFCI